VSGRFFEAKLRCKKCKHDKWHLIEPKENKSFNIYVCALYGRGIKEYIDTKKGREVLPVPYDISEMSVYYVV